MENLYMSAGAKGKLSTNVDVDTVYGLSLGRP